MISREQKVITGIQMGIVQGKVAWVFQYKGNRQESFSLHVPVARQFMQGLQELVLLLESQQGKPSGTLDGLDISDKATVRLIGGEGEMA